MKKLYTQKSKFLFLLFSFFFFTNNDAFASHVMGADISYTCLGANQYRVRLSLYRDCSGIDLPAIDNILISSVSCGRSFSVNIDRLPGYPIEVSPLCGASIGSSTCSGGTLPGVEQHVYEGIITMPAACADWVISWQACCRNSAITTLVTPSTEGVYIETKLNNLLTPCDNSPVFTTLPVPFVCNLIPFVYNHGAVDPDGDSLYYKLVPCLDTGPGDSVFYNTGRSSVSPLATTTGTYIDPNNGNVFFTPNGIQVAVMAILVEEYRGGVLIGSTMRDIQITVLICTNNPPVLDTIRNEVGGTRINPYRYMVCAGDTISFDVYASDVDPGDSLLMTSNVATAIPGATFTSPPYDTSSIFGTFRWITTDADIGFNSFVVNVKDDACPVFGNTVRAYDVVVVGVAVLAPDTQVVCLGDNVTLQGVGSADLYTWHVLSGDSSSLICSTCNPIIVQPLYTTTYEVVGTTPLGCKNRDTVTLIVIPTFTITASNDTSLCVSNHGVKLNVSTSSPGAYNYAWSPSIGLSDSTSPYPLATPTVSTTYIVHVGAGSSCDKWDTVRVTIAVGGVNTTNASICLGDWYPFRGGSYFLPGQYSDTLCDSIFVLNLTVNASDTINENYRVCMGEEIFGYTPSVDSTFISTSLNVFGCDSVFRRNIHVVALPIANAGPDQTIFLGSTTVLTASGGVYYEWSNGTNTASTSVTPLDSMIYFVLVRDADSCISFDTVLVIVNDHEFHVPDAFSPNGDGNNDHFTVFASNFKAFEIHIFNRWGEEMYFSNDLTELNNLNKGWDGYYKGQLQDMGTFVYYVKGIDAFDIASEGKGNISLIK